MITQGQELLIDYDEKTLAEMGFKDTQVSSAQQHCDGLVLIGRNPQNNDFGVTIYSE